MHPGIEALERGWALLRAGSVDEAAEAFKLAADSGIAEGYVQLAEVESRRGNQTASDAYLRQAEALAEAGDALANLSCSLAYQLARGKGSFEEQQQKANDYLRRAAELGEAVAQAMLAQNLLFGLNGETRNEAQYFVWIWRAIDQGLDEALEGHVENMLNLEREIEPRAIAKLEELAARSERAKKLLRKAKSSQA
jgi:TPR repeat protein